MIIGQTSGLQEEIAMLRTAVRRTFELFEGEALDLGSACRALAALGSAASRLAVLLRTQNQIGGKDDGLNALILKAVQKAYQEMSTSDP